MSSIRDSEWGMAKSATPRESGTSLSSLVNKLSPVRGNEPSCLAMRSLPFPENRDPGEMLTSGSSEDVDEVPLGVELEHTAVAVAVGHEEVAVAGHGHIGRLTEVLVVVSGDEFLPESQEGLEVGV